MRSENQMIKNAKKLAKMNYGWALDDNELGSTQAPWLVAAGGRQFQ